MRLSLFVFLSISLSLSYTRTHKLTRFMPVALCCMYCSFDIAFVISRSYTSRLSWAESQGGRARLTMMVMMNSCMASWSRWQKWSDPPHVNSRRRKKSKHPKQFHPHPLAMLIFIEHTDPFIWLLFSNNKEVSKAQRADWVSTVSVPFYPNLGHSS